MRPAMICSSRPRSDPKPHCASTLCRRWGPSNTGSVDGRAVFGRFGSLGRRLECGDVGCRFRSIEGRARERELDLGGLWGGIGKLQKMRSIELRQWRQLRERAKAKIVENGLGARIEGRTARGFPMTDDFDPLPVFECLDDVGRYSHAADGFDVAACDGLPVSDDG